MIQASKLLVFSNIAAMKILPQMSAMGGDVRMDRHLEKHIVLGRPGEALQERGRNKSRIRALHTAHKTSSPRGYHLRCAGSPALWVVLSQVGLGRE